MTTITVVVNKEKKPQYKDYVNFLDNYKNSKKDESDGNSIGYSLSSSSLSSIDIETELPTKSFNEYMQNYSTKKYQPVQPKLQTKQKNVKTEVFIQINNNEDKGSYSPKSVDEIAKVFNNKTKNIINNNNHNLPPLSKGTNIKITPKSPLPSRSPINIGRETRNTPPMSPVLAALSRKFSSETITIPPKSPVFNTQPRKVMNLNGNLAPKPFVSATSIPITKTTPPVNEVPITPHSEISTTKSEIPTTPPPPPPPPPPMMPSTPVKPTFNYGSKSSTLPRMTNNNHHIQSDAVDSLTLSKNDPRVKKAVYGALRNMYGAYHDKANDYLSTLPKNRVKKGNGLDSIINSIAAQGGLEKLNGRAKIEAD